MNHIYKVVWNKAKHAYVVTAEIAKTYTKSAGSRAGKLAAVMAAATVLSFGFNAPAAQAVDAPDHGFAEQGTVIGKDNTEYSGSVTIGLGSESTGKNNVTIGNGAVANGDQATAIGQAAKATGNNATAFGANAFAETPNSLAVGSVTSAEGDHAVALGNDSVATEDNVVSVGHKSTDSNGQDAYGSDLRRRIINVADGHIALGSSDAVTGGQLYKEQEERMAADTILGSEIDSVGALSAALAGLHPLDYDASQSKYQLAAAVGGYDGAYALALGGFYNVNQDILLSGGVSTILKGDRKTAGNLGVTFRVGAGNAGESLGAASDLNEANQRLAALSQENKVLAGQNRKLSDRVAAQDQKIAAQDEKLADLAAQVAALTKNAK